MEITWLDILVVAVIVASAGYAAWKGLLRESLSIFAWALAAYAALVFGPFLRTPMHELFAAKWLGDVIAYAGVFLIVLVPLSFLSFRFSESIQKSPVGPVDRSLGFVFGIGRGLVLVALPYIAFTMLVPVRDQPAWIGHSAMFPLVQKTSDVILGMVPRQDREARPSLARHGRHEDTETAEKPPVVQKPAAPHRQAAKPTPKPQVQQHRPQRTAGQETHQKTYGPRERRELDRLIETTGGEDTQAQ